MEPNDIEGRQFGSTLRGYDRQEVEDFIREVAEYVRHLTKKLAGVESALEAARSAPPAAPPPQVPDVPAQPESAATQSEKTDVFKQLGEETARILISAEQAGNQIKEEAKREAAEVLADARREAGRIARQAREGRQKAEGDLRQFLQARGLLAEQLEDVRRRLAEAVARLQAPLDPEEPEVPKPADQSLEPAAIKPQQGPAEKQPPEPKRAAAVAKEPPLRSIGTIPKEPPPEQHRVGRIIESTQFPPPRLVPATRDVSREDEKKKRPDLPKAPERASGIEKAAESESKVEEAIPAPANGTKRKTESSRDIVEQLLEEIREDTKEDSDDLPKSISSDAKPPAGIPATIAEAGPEQVALNIPKDASYEAARKLKRLLQEDHNDLLHRLRSQRGRGTLEENIASESEQMDRFNTALRPLLHKAFVEGRRAANGAGEGNPDAFLSSLIAKQVVLPLRSELCRVVEAGLEAKDTSTAISERAGDVFRIWKGLRTELLGEGLVSAAFHEGLLGVWRADPGKAKRWVLSPEEQECPKGVCRTNAAQGSVPAGRAFASGHSGPPAHGGCTCGLEPS